MVSWIGQSSVRRHGALLFRRRGRGCLSGDAAGLERNFFVAQTWSACEGSGKTSLTSRRSDSTRAELPARSAAWIFS